MLKCKCWQCAFDGQPHHRDRTEKAISHTKIFDLKLDTPPVKLPCDGQEIINMKFHVPPRKHSYGLPVSLENNEKVKTKNTVF